MARTMEFCDYSNADKTALFVADLFREYESRRSGFLKLAEEARQYVFATDTKSTSASKLHWKNSVHIPKLCQIRDNLHSNYMAALWPSDRAIAWEGDDETSQTKEKRKTIEAYVQNKLRQSKFATELSRCVLDFIDYGNCFATVDYVVDRVEAPSGTTATYIGPRFRRISPLDIVFDPTAARFEDSPKIVRSIKTIGDLKLEIENNPDKGYYQEVFDKLIDLRKKFSGSNQGDISKNSQFIVDGFTSFLDYFKSNYVEVLDFYGDVYDEEKGELLRNQVVTVIDRCYVIKQSGLDNWLGTAPFFHAGWRLRPDNLYAMGPLDNLIGMQYRIDHLENAKADGIDLIIHPVMKIMGSVEAFKYGPGERIYISDVEAGDVDFMHPDTTIFQVDTQIMLYEQRMEEMVGMPKHAMGFRTPGEKTAYEMQVLDQAGNKIFINKTSYLDEIFVEPAMNAMLEAGRRNLAGSESIRIQDEDFNFEEFMTVTKEDITAIGKIRPMGARRFARNANLLQNLTTLSGTPLYMDPSINTHFSGKKIARLLENLLDLEDYKLVEDNIRVIESVETQQMQSDGQQLLMERGAIPNSVPGAPPNAQGSVAATPGGAPVSQ